LFFQFVRHAMLCLAGCLPAAALAQGTYPVKPIQFIVPYAAGGNGDIVTRIVSQKLASVLGQPLLIDNRPGAGGNIGAEAAARAAPDGYTLVLTSGTHAINMSLYKTLRYDIVKDFAPSPCSVPRPSC